MRILLKEEAIADFIAIAILRTNNEEVKGVCAECLFNLLRAPGPRPLVRPRAGVAVSSRNDRRAQLDEYFAVERRPALP